MTNMNLPRPTAALYVGNMVEPYITDRNADKLKGIMASSDTAWLAVANLACTVAEGETFEAVDYERYGQRLDHNNFARDPVNQPTPWHQKELAIKHPKGNPEDRLRVAASSSTLLRELVFVREEEVQYYTGGPSSYEHVYAHGTDYVGPNYGVAIDRRWFKPFKKSPNEVDAVARLFATSSSTPDGIADMGRSIGFEIEETDRRTNRTRVVARAKFETDEEATELLQSDIKIFSTVVGAALEALPVAQQKKVLKAASLK